MRHVRHTAKKTLNTKYQTQHPANTSRWDLHGERPLCGAHAPMTVIGIEQAIEVAQNN
jgi:hypothetical protein